MGMTMRRMKMMVPSAVVLGSIGTISAGGIASACEDTSQGSAVMHNSQQKMQGQSKASSYMNTGEHYTDAQHAQSSSYHSNGSGQANGQLAHGTNNQAYSSDQNNAQNTSHNNSNAAHVTTATSSESDDQSIEMHMKHATLRSDMQEHAALAAPALQAELDQSADREAWMKAVEQNSQAIARDVSMMASMTSQSGENNTDNNSSQTQTNSNDPAQQNDQAYNEFLPLWRSHVTEYMHYAQGARTNDTAMKDSAKQNLATFADQASTWMSNHNKNLDKQHMHQMFTMHGNHVLSMVDSMAAKNYEATATTAHQAYQHMGMVADYLSSGWWGDKNGHNNASTTNVTMT